MRFPLNTIICGDSKDLSFMPNGVVDLTVTSPPYRNAIDYNSHLKGEWFRGKTRKSIEEYLTEMKQVFKEVYRVTKIGGFCAIVIGNEIVNGNIIPLPHLLLSELLKIGWRLQEEIIWHKVTGGTNRFSVTVKNPYPTYYLANIMHEHIFVLRKGGKIRRKVPNEKIVLNDLMKKEVANSVWHIAPVPPGYLEHPCPYPEEIPYRLILLYTYAGDFVFDPFVGSGQTTKVAKALNRNFLGIDIIPEYVDLAIKRLNEPLHLRNPLIPKWIKLKKEVLLLGKR